MDEPPRISFFKKGFNIVRRFFVWFLLILVALWSYGFYELGRTVVYGENPGLSGAQQAADTLKKVGALIELPANETPNMAVINDAASVKKSQPFLANAEDGDILIVYQSAQTALLYRPSADKLIAVGPITSQAAATQPAQQPINISTASTTKNETKNPPLKK